MECGRPMYAVSGESNGSMLGDTREEYTWRRWGFPHPHDHTLAAPCCHTPQHTDIYNLYRFKDFEVS